MTDPNPRDDTDTVAQKTKDSEEPGKADVAQTAEFDYVDDWSDEDEEGEAAAMNASSDAPMSGRNPNRSKSPWGASKGDASADDNVGGTVERALDGFDAFLDEESDEASNSSGNLSSSGLSSPGLSSPGRRGDNSGYGFDSGTSQTSGVFSRYDEATEGAASGDFDLFDDGPDGAPREQTLQDVVNAHEKKIRLLKKRLAYQKEVIQVVSELLVEARVISRSELKKRLRALRDKNA